MDGRIVLALALSALVAVVAGAAYRRRARTARGRAQDLRRSSGVVVLAALAGFAFMPDWSRDFAALAVAMVAFAVVGWLADRGRLRGPALTGAILAAAVVPVLGGARIGFVGVPLTDAVVSVVWVAALTSAVAGLGNTDGLVPGVAVFAGAGIFTLAAFGDQDDLAVVAIATVGATLGFLTYNLRPASLYIGQAGGLVLGVLLSVGAMEVRPGIDAPGSLAVPLILLGLPLTDGLLVLLGRLRHRRRVFVRRADHLAHRLRALGWRTPRIFRVLVAVQVLLSADALFVGRGVLPLAPGLVLAVVPLLILAAWAARGDVYNEQAKGFSARLVLGVLGVAVAAVLVSIPGGLAAQDARSSLEDGRRLAEEAIDAARRGEPDVAAERFAEAEVAFKDARDRLYNPVVLGGLAVPVFGSNLHASRVLADAGYDLSRAGEQLTAPVDQEKLRVRDGTVDLEEVRRITPSLEAAAELLDETEARVRALPTGYLIDPVRDAVTEVESEVGRAAIDAENGAGAAVLAPEILGGDEPRRYFLAVQNPAELRATGGFIGSWGILSAANGKVDLEFIEPVRLLNEGGDPDRTISGPDEYLRRYGRFEPAVTWQNVNMSPDFPIVGEVISELYPQSGGEPVDGVIAVDPAGLAALLELTGPVTVEGWPEPITADNVVSITLDEAYRVFEEQGAAREDFLGDVAEEVFDVATEGDLGRPATIAEVLGRASREGHISVYFTRPEEESLAELVNVEGSVPQPPSDSLMVVTQNAGANKIDYYLQRQVDYSVTLDPTSSGEQVDVRGELDVVLENTGPAEGLPRSVIGPSEGLEDRFVAGENFAFVSVFTPLVVRNADIENATTDMEADRELGRNVYAAFVSTYSGSTTTLSLDVEGLVPLDDGWYGLTLVRQPFITPDEVAVELEVPSGWKIAETEGLEPDGDRRATGRVALTETTEVRVRLEPTSPNIWYRLHQGS